jgi:hypothetical protein
MPEEVEIEVFRADPRASRGITADILAGIATEFDGNGDPVPICIGHPTSNAPGYGEIKAFRAEGPSLFATLAGKFDKIVEGVKDGSILNRSMAFWPAGHSSNPKPGRIWPRHLGFLGASTPGIPNMPRLDKALAFSADDDNIETIGDPAPAVIEDAPPTPVLHFQSRQEPTPMAEPTAEEIAESRRKLEADQLAFAASQRTARETANASTVDALVAGGKLLPAHRDRTLFVFNALGSTDHEDKALEFDAGDGKKLSPASALADLLGGAVKLVPVNEGRRAPSTEFNADEVKGDDKKITAAARKLMESDKTLTFEAAVEAVTEQQEG